MREQIRQAVGFRSEEDHRYGSIAYALLLGKALVYGNQDVEMRRHRVKKRPVV